MSIEFILPSLPNPQFSEMLFQSPLATIRGIATRNQERFNQGNETRQFKNRKEKLIKRLKTVSQYRRKFQPSNGCLGQGTAPAQYLPGVFRKPYFKLLAAAI